MDGGWHLRREHYRWLPAGRAVRVRQAWVCQEGSQKGNAFKRVCPNCGADITSVRMPRGGWAHFEGRKGLTHLKHPCLHLGEKLSRRRDSKTLDLFDVGAL